MLYSLHLKQWVLNFLFEILNLQHERNLAPSQNLSFVRARGSVGQWVWEGESHPTAERAREKGGGGLADLKGNVVLHDPLQLSHLLLHGCHLALHLHHLGLLALPVPLLGLLILLLLPQSAGCVACSSGRMALKGWGWGWGGAGLAGGGVLREDEGCNTDTAAGQTNSAHAAKH